jgi:rfaE bifunctional protein nucleotidyltransferase chain/domain
MGSHNGEMTPQGARVARDKVRTIEQLTDIAETLRKEGKSVALCHGVFDLVHMGHVRHLEAARREGDVLIVTITADRFVNKGPGRPIFSERMRAEMLAALEYVDWVSINHGSSAESVLDAIKPDVYVKGSDYENPEEDITGKIAVERDAVERHGGRIVFTKDITFSSSTLINRYLDVYDPPLRDFLDNLRSSGGSERILELIESVRHKKILLVGDAIIDEYQYVNPLGKSAKEHIIATIYEGKEVFAGGVFAAANHVAEFCAEVQIITALGENCPYEALIRQSLKPNVKLHVVPLAGRPTTRKLRYVEPSYMRKMFEVYFMDDRPLPDPSYARLAELVEAHAKDGDLVLVTDFGHGMISNGLVTTLRAASRFLAVNAQTNSGNQGFNLITKYRNADYVCIDAPEARLAAADKYSDIAVIVGETLPRQIACRRLIVTHGSMGCYTFDAGEGEVRRIPAFTKTIVDTVGAGDAFFTVTAPLVAAGGRILDVGFVGNAAGAMKVGIVGHRKSVEKVPLMKFVTTLLK